MWRHQSKTDHAANERGESAVSDVIIASDHLTSINFLNLEGGDSRSQKEHSSADE